MCNERTHKTCRMDSSNKYKKSKKFIFSYIYLHKMTDILQYSPILLPILICFSISLRCNMSTIFGGSVKTKPSSDLFYTMWIVLYFFMGLSWYFARTEPIINTFFIDTKYIFINVFLVLWVIEYKNDKVAASSMLVLALVFTLLAYTLGNVYSKSLITPLIGWLVYLLIVNSLDANNYQA